MFIYGTARAVNDTTNGSANTDTDHLRYLTVSPAKCNIRALYIGGKAAAATTITGIAIWLKRFATASTVGSAIVPQPREPTAPAAVTTPFTLPTIGATPTVQKLLTCGKGGPAAWVAQDRDDEIVLATAGGANGNIDLISQGGEASMPFSYDLAHAE